MKSSTPPRSQEGTNASYLRLLITALHRQGRLKRQHARVRTAADTNTRAPATSLSITAQEDEAAAEADTRHVIEAEQALRRYG